MSWCYIPSCEISSRKKGISFLNFSSEEKTKKISNRHQAESFMTVKQSFLLQGCLAEVLKMAESRLFPALLPSISTGFRHGERLEGAPTSAGI